MSDQTKDVPEVIEPLTAIEASLVATVGVWRESQQRQLELAFQKLLSEANERIAPVLRAHNLVPGDEWDIRQDEASVTGWAVAIKRGALLPKDATPVAVVPLSRTARRRLTKEIVKKASRRGGR